MTVAPSSHLMVTQLAKELHEKVEQLASQISGEKQNIAPPPIEQLLKAALKNEWETAVLTGQWVVTERDAFFCMNLARLAGDEAKHFLKIAELLTARGHAIPSSDELNQRTPLYGHLIKLETTFERVVAGPFAREALAVARNQVFLEYCKKIAANDIILAYEEIQNDEEHHHKLGRTTLEEILRNEQDLGRARVIMNDVLKVVDDIQEMMLMKKGMSCLPGC